MLQAAESDEDGKTNKDQPQKTVSGASIPFGKKKAFLVSSKD